MRRGDHTFGCHYPLHIAVARDVPDRALQQGPERSDTSRSTDAGGVAVARDVLDRALRQKTERSDTSRSTDAGGVAVAHDVPDRAVSRSSFFLKGSLRKRTCFL